MYCICTSISKMHTLNCGYEWATKVQHGRAGKARDSYGRHSACTVLLPDARKKKNLIFNALYREHLESFTNKAGLACIDYA